jgi:hypothetical protein
VTGLIRNHCQCGRVNTDIQVPLLMRNLSIWPGRPRFVGALKKINCQTPPGTRDQSNLDYYSKCWCLVCLKSKDNRRTTNFRGRQWASRERNGCGITYNGGPLPDHRDLMQSGQTRTRRSAKTLASSHSALEVSPEKKTMALGIALPV